MAEIVVRGRDGRPINDWRSWKRPKKADQWRAGRSAMELARAWFASPVPRCPKEVADALASHPLTAGIALSEGIPEHVTPLPERGEGRNHDLLLMGQAGANSILVSVEAKVDEPFGDTIGNYLTKAGRLTQRTRAPHRIRALMSMVFGSSADPSLHPWAGLRYQLLTAVAGTVIEAHHRQADTAVLVVHEFHTNRVDPAKSAANAGDFRAFIAALLSMSPAAVLDGQIYGPARVRVSPTSSESLDILIGKVVCDWQCGEACN